MEKDKQMRLTTLMLYNNYTVQYPSYKNEIEEQERLNRYKRNPCTTLEKI